MNKLGFAVKIASAGAGTALECNRDLWLTKVSDIRDYLKLFNGLRGTDNTVTFMSFDEKGCFLTILRAQAGRDGDYISGWIYIPNNIFISGEQVEQAHDFVKGILAESNLSVVKDQIETFFSTEYPLKEVYSDYLPSSGEEYAGRYIGHYSLREILDKDRYQPYYSKYKAVFLLYKNSEVTVSRESGRKIYDLTKYPIEKTCILMPPSQRDLRHLGDNVRILFENGAEFIKAVAFKIDAEVKLYAVKGSFEPQSFVVKVSDETTFCDLSKLSPDWLMKINRSIFNVIDQDNNQVKYFNLTVGNQMLGIDGYAFLPEEQLRNAQVFIDSPHYEDFYGKFDLTRVPVTIRLERKGREFSSTMRLSNGKPAEVIVRSKYVNPDESPFKGYRISYNELVEDGSYKWKQRLIGALITIGLLALFALYSVFESSDFNPFKETKSEVKTSTSGDDIEDVSDQGINAPSLKDLIEYLDKNKTWNKTELEKFGKGELFTDMNNYNLEQLQSDYIDLVESKNFGYIKEAVIYCLNSRIDPRKGDHNPTWNKGDDPLINIDKYVSWLKNPIEPQTANEKPIVNRNSNSVPSELERQIQKNSQNRQTQQKSTQQPKQSQVGSNQQQKKNQGNKGNFLNE